MANELTRLVFQVNEELEVEFDTEGDDIVIRNNETVPPTEIKFPIEELEEFCAWCKNKKIYLPDIEKKSEKDLQF